ncbi:hypothetical protein [Candidatus Ornithobacterium hominis]|uniref:hypothetical protein n=1 Tax=Candidatus Ornithobacterium hominis TaxID=2497989 RepID=UPI0024BCD12B|nr:hypothetical protein [Candidatus Ornithobacterium hominis]
MICKFSNCLNSRSVSRILLVIDGKESLYKRNLTLRDDNESFRDGSGTVKTNELMIFAKITGLRVVLYINKIYFNQENINHLK